MSVERTNARERESVGWPRSPVTSSRTGGTEFWGRPRRRGPRSVGGRGGGERDRKWEEPNGVDGPVVITGVENVQLGGRDTAPALGTVH